MLAAMMTTQEPTAKSGWAPGRILAVVVVLALVLFWIWIFSGGPARENRDFLGDRRWVARAEATCSATAADIERLPPASGAADATSRADVVDEASDRLELMIDRLARPAPDIATDVKLVDAWLTDWRAYVVNRREYAASLRRDASARLLVNEKFGDPLDTVITTFAEVNDMASCAPPGDVA